MRRLSTWANTVLILSAPSMAPKPQVPYTAAYTVLLESIPKLRSATVGN